MTNAFDPARLNRQYAFLDECPEDLLPLVVTFPLGTLPERVAGVLEWRAALLDGRLPPDATWPGLPVSTPARRALNELGVVRFCAGEPELADRLLGDLLASFARHDAEFRTAVAERLRELDALRRRLLEHFNAEGERKRRQPRRAQTLEGATDGHAAQAAREVAARDVGADAELVQAWSERVRAWAEIAEVFGDLAAVLGRGWNLVPGVLRHAGWLNLVRLHELVRTLAPLREVIEALGRLHASEHGPPVSETILGPVRRIEEERRVVRTPLVRAEARGVERSDDVARMLPAEAALLGHPVLRVLWHARRAERGLLTYRVEGVDYETVTVERESEQPATQTRPRPVRGPVVAVIDTSGSMQGLPEQVAKAVVLEAARTAHAERRRCYTYAFGSTDEIVERELDLSPNGVGRLLGFLGHAFGGGTDGAPVMARVLDRLRAEEWSRADVLLVSDGKWPVPPAIEAAVRDAREQGTRFHGVQVGTRGSTALSILCDPVHVFADWASLGGAVRNPQ